MNMTQTQPKPWRKARTIWFNIAAAMVGLGQELMVVADMLPEEHASTARIVLTAATAIGNVILRFDTKEPIR